MRVIPVLLFLASCAVEAPVDETPPETAVDEGEATLPSVESPPRPLAQIRVTSTTHVNAGNNVSFLPRETFRPNNSIEELVTLVQWVRSLPFRLDIKPAGSLHSFSPVAAAPDSVYVITGDIRFARPAGPNLFTFGAGTRLREINAYLWAQGKALPTLGGFDGQTIAGVYPTGTHGSVLAFGGVNDVVRSLDMVTAAGEKVRLEPRNGISSPAAFARAYPGWRLIQDSATFDAARIGVGGLGLVHAVTVEVVDKFYLRERIVESTGAAAQAILSGENIYNLLQNRTRTPFADARFFPGQPTAPVYHLEVWWNPFTDKAVTVTRDRVPAAEQARLAAREPEEFTATPSDLEHLLTARPQYSRPRFPELATELAPGVVGTLNDLITQLIPGRTPALVDAALDATRDDEFVNRSYNVFNIGSGKNKMHAISCTLSLPIRDDLYLAGMDAVRAQVQQNARNGIYQSGPISVRFVRGSTALLGEPEDAAKFEFVFAGNNPRARDLATRACDSYHRSLRSLFGADLRVHWGQLAPASWTHADVVASHPGLARFVAVVTALDPEHRMLNRWQEQMLLGTP
jgi:hypothetical protein